MFELDILECVPQFVVGVGAEGIEVLSHSALEYEGRLRDDGEGGPESGETDSGSGGVVEEDGGGAIALGETEEGVEQRRLAGSSSTDHPYLHLWLDVEVGILEDGVEIVSVPESGILKSNGSFIGPLSRKS